MRRVQLGGGGEERDLIDERRRRLLAAEVYRPPIARLVILGEAPPPDRFFYYGNSLFFRFLRRAFASLVPDVDSHGADWFLAFYRQLGGWRTDVCDTPQRATKGGADDISGCVEKFLARWQRDVRDPEAVLVVSPRRLVPSLPDEVREQVLTSVPPPGQWNAHREAFLRDMDRVLRHHVGTDVLQAAASATDAEEAALEFDIARACADGSAWEEIDRLITGHPREAALRHVWNENGE